MIEMSYYLLHYTFCYSRSSFWYY